MIFDISTNSRISENFNNYRDNVYCDIFICDNRSMKMWYWHILKYKQSEESPTMMSALNRIAGSVLHKFILTLKHRHQAQINF